MVPPADIMADSHSAGDASAGAAGAPVVCDVLVGRGAVTDLLEREGEIATLDALLDKLAEGVSNLVVVEGPGGIGKSRLLDALRERARLRGVQRLSARGADLEKEFPFGAVRQLFEPTLARGPGDLLTGAASAAEAVFAVPDQDAHPWREPAGSFAVLHGLYWLTVRLADDGPLLLTVDDLHWVDLPSLRFLSFLARRLEGLGALVAVGTRTADPGTEPALVGELVETPGTHVLRPRPLSAVGVARLVQARLKEAPDPAFTAACLDAAGGNPLFLTQLLGGLADAGVPPNAEQVEAVRRVGPRAASRTVLGRLARLPDDATAVAQALAVLGTRFGVSPVEALTGLGEQRVARAMADLAQAEILTSQTPTEFLHPLVRDAVYDSLPPATRGLRHADAARMLRDSGAADEEVATQLLAATRRGDQEVVDVLVAAAGSARDRGATDSAVAYLYRALDEPPPPARRPSLRLELGRHEAMVDGPRAAANLRAALDELEGHPRLRAEAAEALARCLLFTGPPEAAVKVACQAARNLPDELSEQRHGLEATELLGVTFGAEADQDTDARLRAARTHPRSDGLAAVAAWDWAMTDGTAEQCAELARQALADGGLMQTGDFVMAGTAVGVLVMAETDDAEDALDALEAAGYRHGSHFGVNTAHYFRAGLWLRRGELADAASELGRAREAARLWGDTSWEDAELARVVLERGDLTEASRLVAGARVHSPYSIPAHGVRRAQVELLLAEGRAQEALDAAEDYARHLTRRADNPAFAPWRSLTATALHRCGRAAEARALAEEELALARRWGGAGTTGRSLRILGTLEGEQGVPRLREAVAVLSDSPARLEHARALAALGAVLRRTGQRTEARTPLREALDLAERSGALGLRESVRTELHAAGARPRSTALSGLAALTPSERRVAQLAAAGRSNREIAQTLFVTPKTVELHLSRSYRKLGVGSRGDLAEALVG
jgi:DNA-binding NarL/FixJ family response regulator